MSRNVVIGLFPISLELDGALFRSVFAEHALAGGAAHREPPLVVYIAQVAERLLGGRRHQNLAADREDAVEAFPPVADHRGGACAGFEEPHAR
jgi:hypothetical protein